jgi:hypothetical protein
MSEIMTEKGLTLGAFINWVCTIVLGLFAQDIIQALGDGGTGSGYLFFIFSFCTFCGGLFCQFVLKETSGLSEKEVANLFVSETEMAQI